MVHHSIAVVITSFLTNFVEFCKAEVRRIPKFSGSWAVASRNRLLRSSLL